MFAAERIERASGDLLEEHTQKNVPETGIDDAFFGGRACSKECEPFFPGHRVHGKPRGQARGVGEELHDGDAGARRAAELVQILRDRILQIDPAFLLHELEELKARGVNIGELRISDRAHVVMPYHKTIDALEEELKGNLAAGTTKRGIGPCYMDKVSRFGVRMCDLVDPPSFMEKLEKTYWVKSRYIEALGGGIGQTMDDIYNEYLSYAKALAPMILDTSVLINEVLDSGKNVLLE